jgi:hypothetical protein
MKLRNYFYFQLNVESFSLPRKNIFLSMMTVCIILLLLYPALSDFYLPSHAPPPSHPCHLSLNTYFILFLIGQIIEPQFVLNTENF